MSNEIYLCDNNGNRVSPGVSCGDPALASGITLIDTAIGANHIQTLVAGSVYQVSVTEIGGMVFGVAPLTAIDKNLISLWTMDNIVDAVVIDDMGRNNGTLEADAAQVTGIIGKAITFDGVEDHINLPNFIATNELVKFSVSLWFKIDDSLPFTSTHALVCLGDLSNRIPWIFAINGTSIIKAQMYDGSAVVETIYTMTGGDVGKWHNLIYTYNWTGTSNDGDAILYIDGISQDTDKTISTSGVVSNVGFIGNNSALQYMKGEVDDVRLYNRILSQDEITWMNSLSTDANALALHVASSNANVLFIVEANGRYIFKMPAGYTDLYYQGLVNGATAYITRMK